MISRVIIIISIIIMNITLINLITSIINTKTSIIFITITITTLVYIESSSGSSWLCRVNQPEIPGFNLTMHERNDH